MPTKPDPILKLDDLSIHFELQGSALARLLGRRDNVVKAVDGVNLTIERGEVLGLVGESGSGKTTLGRAMLGLADVTAGRIDFYPRAAEGDDRSGQPITRMKGAALRSLRTCLQMVFQDPHAALNPSMTIEKAVGHPLVIHRRASGAELRRRVVEALEHVGLSPATQFLDKYPVDLSGGQKQRAVLARAIILEPEVLVADEPVSMLDMSVRAKILQLMLDLKDDLGLTYIYITHDLATAKFFCDRVAIMYLGKIVEMGPTEEIFVNPRHPYTRSLLKAIPDLDVNEERVFDLPRGEIPDASYPPRGCAFHPRCPDAVARCGWEPRDVRALVEEHWTRVDLGEFERDQKLLGSLESLDHSGDEALIRPHHGGSPADLLALLQRIRSENSHEPLWSGVRSLEVQGDAVRIVFAEPADIRLHTVDGVDVACVHYETEGAG